MPASLERMRRTMQTTVGPTPQNKGLKMTLTIDAYDNGKVAVDNILMSDGADQAEAWLRAAMVTVQMLEEFKRQVSRRQAERASAA